MSFTIRAFWLVLLASTMQWQLLGWGGAIHGAITRAAIDSLPPWQQELLGDQRELLISRYSLIPDIVYLPENREEFGPLVVLPDGTRFTHEPHDRAHNHYLMEHYLKKSIEHFRKGNTRLGAQYLGCLLHFLEDSGSPAHSLPGDNQLSLLRDMLVVPERFRNRPLHSLVESGTVDITDFEYQPRLLGETSDEAAFLMVERLNAAVRSARAQLIPILQAVFDEDQPTINRGRNVAATVDAQVAADAIFTIISIAANRFQPEQQESLQMLDWTTLTPLEMVSQSYFPQFAYFTDPYFGYPTQDASLAAGETLQPLMLNVVAGESVREQTFVRGIGLGTHSRLTYALPNLTYDSFEFLGGLHSRLGKDGSIVIRVFADGNAVFSSGLMAGDDPAQRIRVPVWGAHEVTIEIETRNSHKGSNAVVIAEAALHKAIAKKPDPRRRVY